MGKNSRIGFGVIKAGFRCRKMLLQEGMSSWASLENHPRSGSGVDGESRGREAGGLARCLGPTAPHHVALDPPLSPPHLHSLHLYHGGDDTVPSDVGGISSNPAHNHPLHLPDQLLP